MPARRVLVPAVLVAVCSSCGSADQDPTELNAAAPDPRPDIVAAGDEFIALYTDPDSAVSYFTPDGVLIPPSGAAVVGREALLAHLRAGNTGGTWDQSAERDTIFVSGSLAVERGRYRVALLSEDRSEDPLFVGTGPYVIHWALQGGRWRIATYIGAADP
ncbi:MAG: nuclear transport factor 2 family protein [Gemmatimonadetes bacterium]|nr:nuclear transport factor 2 family protein [Gemmatimonadota bacterium]